MATQENLPALTSVRFAFAAMVVIFHGAPLLESAGVVSMSRFTANIIHTGYIGVQFFFVLSGFILTYIYAGESQSKRSFWVARLARIYPGYLLGLLLILPFLVYQAIFAAPASDDPSLRLVGTGLLQVFLLQAWVPGAVLSWNGPGWSLSAEAFFYALFPFLLSRLMALGSRKLIWLAVSLNLGSIALSLLIEETGVSGLTHVAATRPADARGLWHEILSFSPLFRLPEFVVGVAAGVLYIRHKPMIDRWALALATLPALLVIIVLGLFASHIPYLLLNNGAFAVPAALMFLGLACDTRLTGFLSATPLVRLGEASYATYILHVPLGRWFQVWWKNMKLDPFQHPLTFYTLYLLALVVASLLVYQFIERPLRRRIRDSLSDRKRE